MSFLQLMVVVARMRALSHANGMGASSWGRQPLPSQAHLPVRCRRRPRGLGPRPGGSRPLQTACGATRGCVLCRCCPQGRGCPRKRSRTDQLSVQHATVARPAAIPLARSRSTRWVMASHCFGAVGGAHCACSLAKFHRVGAGPLDARAASCWSTALANTPVRPRAGSEGRQAR